MKEDYQKIKDDNAFFDYFKGNLTERQNAIFEGVLRSDSHEEFDLYLKNYELEVENRHLEELLDRPIWKLILSKIR